MCVHVIDSPFLKDADPLLFSFSDTYDPVDFAGARICEARAYNMLKEITDDTGFEKRYLDYAQVVGSR